MLESRIPYLKTIIYNGQLIAIITISTKQLLPPEYVNALQKLCQENGLYAGVSNCFQNILKIEEYYNQALRAIELGICKADIRNPLSLLAHERSRFATCQWDLLTPPDISIPLPHYLVLYTLEAGEWLFCVQKNQYPDRGGF